MSQEQSAELGYSSGYPGEKMVPLSDVMFPPHGTVGGREGGRAQAERQSTCITGPGMQWDRSVIRLQSLEKGDFSPPPSFSTLTLLSVSLPLSFTLRLVPGCLSELKISQ